MLSRCSPKTVAVGTAKIHHPAPNNTARPYWTHPGCGGFAVGGKTNMDTKTDSILNKAQVVADALGKSASNVI